MPTYSRLIKMKIVNIGCIGSVGLEIEMDKIITIVGQNNTGKSTVLKAYEYAVGTKKLKQIDKNKNALDKLSFVEIWAHIPEGTENVGSKWKFMENGLLMVKSRWEWDENCNKIRKTWDPEINDYAEDGKAGGLDEVFNSRLPKPFRIEALGGPIDEHDNMITLIIQPIEDKLKILLDQEESDISKCLQEFKKQAEIPVNEERVKIDIIKKDLNKSHNSIFPDLKIDFDIGLGEIKIEPISFLKNNSRIIFDECGCKTEWDQQGTGSQRALFWALMQVRSKLQTLNDEKVKIESDLKMLEKQKTRLNKEIATSKKPETKNKKNEEVKAIEKQILELKTPVTTKKELQEAVFPSYMLLIDEPEIALHPNAIRAASKQLYELANNDSWQVMITTHSPSFVDPLSDHTTIIRLARDNDKLVPKLFRADDEKFSDEEKESLKVLLRFDTGLAEMFFGQYPIIIEGDTEFAAFEYLINNKPEKYITSKKPILIRARGKGTIILLLKILIHFKIPFSLLHDLDYPKTEEGNSNPAWSLNKSIFDVVQTARKNGMKVIHQLSVPSFEIEHCGVKKRKDNSVIEYALKEKPWNVIKAINSKEEIQKSIEAKFDSLLPDGYENTFELKDEASFNSIIKDWAKKNDIKDNKIF